LNNQLKLALLVVGLLGAARMALAESVTEAWSQRYGTTGGGGEFPSAITTDRSNNIIAVGFARDGILEDAIFTVKYSSAGDTLWTARWGLPFAEFQTAQAVATSTNGNLYVAGYSDKTNGTSEYVVLAYSSSGSLLWTNLYRGPGQGNDRVTGLAVTANGEVFVTGYSFATNGNTDYATIAYSAAGVALWTNRFHGPGSGWDSATAITLDSLGNVVVSGYSSAANGAADFATVAYSAAGVPLWTNRYDGPSHTSDGGNVIAASSNGNVIVSGSSADSTVVTTIAYSGSGVALWTNRCPGGEATALRVDASGAVSLSLQSADHVVIRYSAGGLPLWTNSLSGYAGGLDIDSSGNVFASGYVIDPQGNRDYQTAAYSTLGVPLWTNRYDSGREDHAISLAVAPNGNILVTGDSQGRGVDIVTLAYSLQGTALWTNRYDGPGNMDDKPTALAVGSGGHVAVTGTCVGLDGSTDYVTVEYSASGLALWTNYFAGSTHNVDVPVAIAVFANGDVIATGSSRSDSSDYDYLTVAYSVQGIPLWTNYYGGQGLPDEAKAIGIHTNGVAYVTGYSVQGVPESQTPSVRAYTTLAYASNGAVLWTNRYTETGKFATATALAVDHNGNVAVTGYIGESIASNDVVTIKYSGDGLSLWTNRYEGSSHNEDAPQAIAMDPQGNIFVGGYSVGLGGVINYFVVAYSSAGAPLWTNLYTGPGIYDGPATSVAASKSGNVYVIGSSQAPNDPAQSDYLTIAYSTGGVSLWTNSYEAISNLNAYGVGIGTDADGNVFVSGHSATGFNAQDLTTIKYSADGAILWIKHYDGPAGGTEEMQSLRCLAVGPDGGVLVAGASDGNFRPETAYDFAVVKYISLPEIASQPVSVAKAVGSSAAFTVSATGSASLRYQWIRSGTNLLDGGNVFGVTSNTLALANVQMSDSADYRVIITNAFGSVTSLVATLTVIEPPKISVNSIMITNGAFSFVFTNPPGKTFTVLTTTNITLPLVNWTVSPGLSEVSPGQYRFVDPQPANRTQRYYTVRSP
jgi:uncharacterized delta-60 repeat protein